MTIIDKNQTLQPPYGYRPHSIVADGAYLRAEYRQRIFKTGTETVIGENIVIIFLNDQGREVAQAITRNYWQDTRIETKVTAPIARWFRFRDGFLITLQGVWEMIRCLKNS